MNNRVSIIIPAYNAENFIKRALISCINQTYANLEIIIIDDGSTDNTLSLIKEIIDSRIKVMSQTNGGVCSARNKGLNYSTGNFVLFLDADDEMPFFAVERMLKAALTTKSDIVIGRHEVYKDDRDYEVVTCSQLQIEKSDSLLINCLEDDPITYSVWSKLYKKSFIGETRFVEGKKINEDAYFIFELSLKQPSYCIINDCTYLIHKTPDSASRSLFSDRFFDIIFFRNRKIKIIQADYPQYIKYIPNLIIKSDMALLAKMIQYRNVDKQIEKMYIKEIRANSKDFIPKTKDNRRFFFIIKNNLYFFYKRYKMLKSKMRKL